MIDDSVDIFRTKDTPLASYLISEGFTMSFIEYENDTAYFVFSNSNEHLQSLIRDFTMHKAIGNIRAYEDARRELTDRLKRRLP